jgi:hypothetical protein
MTWEGRTQVTTEVRDAAFTRTAGPSCQQGELRTEARDHSELMALGRRIAASSPSSRERVVVLGTEGRNDALEAPAAPAPERTPAR